MNFHTSILVSVTSTVQRYKQCLVTGSFFQYFDTLSSKTDKHLQLSICPNDMFCVHSDR